MAPALALLLLVSAPSGLSVVRGPEAVLQSSKKSETPTVVHFWATWCGPCVAEMPEILRLQSGLAVLGAQMVLVSLDPPKDAVKVAGFLREHRLLEVSGTEAVLLDAPDPAPITKRFDRHWSAQLPATFVVLQSGAVVSSHLGTTPVDAVLGEVRERIDALHAGPAPVRRTP